MAALRCRCPDAAGAPGEDEAHAAVQQERLGQFYRQRSGRAIRSEFSQPDPGAIEAPQRLSAVSQPHKVPPRLWMTVPRLLRPVPISLVSFIFLPPVLEHGPNGQFGRQDRRTMMESQGNGTASNPCALQLRLYIIAGSAQ